MSDVLPVFRVPKKLKSEERADQAQQASSTPVPCLIRTTIFKQEWKNIQVGESNYLRFQKMKDSELWMVYNEDSRHKYFYKTMAVSEIDLWFSFADTELTFTELLHLLAKKHGNEKGN